MAYALVMAGMVVGLLLLALVASSASSRFGILLFLTLAILAGIFVFSSRGYDLMDDAFYSLTWHHL